MLTPYLPAGLTGWLSCALLCGLGLLKLFDSAIKRLVRRLPQPGRELSFSFLRMRFLLRVWADPATADTDCSSVLSAAESVALALALSSDGLAARAGRRIFRPFPLGGVFLFRRNESDLHSHRQPGRKKSSPAAPALTCPGWAASSFSEWGCWPLCKSIFSAP